MLNFHIQYLDRGAFSSKLNTVKGGVHLSMTCILTQKGSTSPQTAEIQPSAGGGDVSDLLYSERKRLQQQTS